MGLSVIINSRSLCTPAGDPLSSVAFRFLCHDLGVAHPLFNVVGVGVGVAVDVAVVFDDDDDDLLITQRPFWRSQLSTHTRSMDMDMDIGLVELAESPLRWWWVLSSSSLKATCWASERW